jgi:hypothetical protein
VRIGTFHTKTAIIFFCSWLQPKVELEQAAAEAQRKAENRQRAGTGLSASHDALHAVQIALP